MNTTRWSQALTDSISTGICILNKEFRIELWNEFLESYTGIDREEILGKAIGDYFPAFKEERYRERIDLLFEGWPPLFFSSRLNTLFLSEGDEGSSRKYQDVSAKAIHGDSGDEWFVLFSVVDVTDLNRKLEERNMLYKETKEEVARRQKVEKELLESESRLREMNRMKDSLMSIIAHDLRSPLASNITGLEVLCTNYDETQDEDRKEILEMLLDSTRQTHRLLEDLLTWSRLQSNQKEISKLPFLMKQLVESEVVKMEHISREKGITLVRDRLQDAMVEADPNMIQAVLRNLISNAIKFTHDGGRIEVSSQVKDGEILVSVNDTGLGMDEKKVEDLFKLNRPESTPGTRDEKGTGFGLAICKEFLEKNQGALQVKSVPGQGSDFTFSLPLHQNTES